LRRRKPCRDLIAQMEIAGKGGGWKPRQSSNERRATNHLVITIAFEE